MYFFLVSYTLPNESQVNSDGILCTTLLFILDFMNEETIKQKELSDERKYDNKMNDIRIKTGIYRTMTKSKREKEIDPYRK